MKWYRCIIILTMGMALGLILPSAALTQADKIIGISSPDYGYVPVHPLSQFAGGFTLFNQGTEDVRAYAEFHGAPGAVFIEWQNPATNQWEETPEIVIPVKEHRYGRFLIIIGNMVQGQFYNWTLTCGYVNENPKLAAVAQAGIRINMIYPFLPPEPLKWYQSNGLQALIMLSVVIGTILSLGIRYAKQLNKRVPYHDLQKH